MNIRYAFLVNAQKCIACCACSMACKNYQHQEPHVIWRAIYPLSEDIYPHSERSFYSLACNHCDNPACLSACPASTYEIRPDGIVVHNQEHCVGCKNCIRSCPYGAPRFDPVAKQAQKCSMCYERIDAGLLPACVQACPTGALSLIDLNNYDNANTVQYPIGYPVMPKLNPSTRFIIDKTPRLVLQKNKEQ